MCVKLYLCRSRHRRRRRIAKWEGTGRFRRRRIAKQSAASCCCRFAWNAFWKNCLEVKLATNLALPNNPPVVAVLLPNKPPPVLADVVLPNKPPVVVVLLPPVVACPAVAWGCCCACCCDWICANASTFKLDSSAKGEGPTRAFSMGFFRANTSVVSPWWRRYAK